MSTNEIKITQSRWKSPILWAAIAAQVFVLAKVVGLWERIGIDEGGASDAVAGIIQLLVIVGILNNPTDVKNW